MKSGAPASAGVVFYDGECGFCRGGIRLLMKLDRGARLRFAPLAGTTAAELSARLGRPLAAGESIVYWRENRELLEQSDAVLGFLADVGGPWRGVALLRVVPRVWRDPVYRFIARHRHRLAPKSSCQLPSPGEAARFLP